MPIATKVEPTITPTKSQSVDSLPPIENPTPEAKPLPVKRMKIAKYYVVVSYQESGKPTLQLCDSYNYATGLTHDDIYEIEIPLKSKEQEAMNKPRYEKESI